VAGHRWKAPGAGGANQPALKLKRRIGPFLSLDGHGCKGVIRKSPVVQRSFELHVHFQLVPRSGTNEGEAERLRVVEAEGTTLTLP
jgi:hypothetical protein